MWHKVDKSWGSSFQKLNEEFRKAAENGQLTDLKRLAELDEVDPASNKNYALCKSAANGHLECVKFLCGLPEVDPSANHCQALSTAASHGQLEIVKFLCGIPKARNNNLAILSAAEFGHLEVVKFLSALPDAPFDKSTIEYNLATYNIKPTARMEALCKASEKGQLDIVKFLCSLPGEAPSARELSKAISSGQLEVVKFLCTFPKIIKSLYSVHDSLRSAKDFYQHVAVADHILSLPIYNPFRPGLSFGDKQHLLRHLKEFGFTNCIEAHRINARENMKFLFFKDLGSAFNKLPNELKHKIVEMSEAVDRQDLSIFNPKK